MCEIIPKGLKYKLPSDKKKKDVLRFRSVKSIVIAPDKTGKMIKLTEQ